MRRTLTAFAVATALGAAPSFAASPALSNPGAQIENLTPTVVSDLLTELGVQNVQQRDVEGTKVLSFEDAGIPFNLGVVCNEGVCTELFMIVGLSTGTTKFPLELLNAYNKQQGFITVTQMDAQKIGMTRALITDGGVSKKNVAVNVATFAFVVRESLKYLSTQLVAGYQQGGSAQYLRAGLGMSPPRPVFLSPQEVAHAMATLKTHHATSLRQPR